MKSYIVYDQSGAEFAIIKAGSHNAAEAKAKELYGDRVGGIAYTEV
jgi:hypothetical protein